MNRFSKYFYICLVVVVITMLVVTLVWTVIKYQEAKADSVELTFYPQLDGRVSRDVTEAWEPIHDGVGTGAVDDGDFGYMQISWHGGNQNYRDIIRTIIVFDTSEIPDSATVVSATFSVYGSYKDDGGSISPTFNIYWCSPASDTELVAGDYDLARWGSTAYCDTVITYANFNVGTPGEANEFVLNATGLSAISKTGVTRIGMREASYDAPDIDPEMSGGVTVSSGARPWFSEEGAAYRPKLVVTYDILLAPGVPTNLSLEDLGGSGVVVSWDKDGDAVETVVRYLREEYSDNYSSGEFVYRGEGTSVNVTGLNLDYVKYCFSAWSWNDAGYSVNYTGGEIGGEALQDTVIMLVPMGFGMGLLCLNVFLKRPLIYLMVIPCMFSVVIEPAFQNMWFQVSAVGVMIWCVLAFFVRMTKPVEG